MPYFKYEWLIEDILEEQKKQEEQRKREEEERQKNQRMPKTPKMPTYKPPSLPRVSIPKY